MIDYLDHHSDHISKIMVLHDSAGIDREHQKTIYSQQGTRHEVAAGKWNPRQQNPACKRGTRAKRDL